MLRLVFCSFTRLFEPRGAWHTSQQVSPQQQQGIYYVTPLAAERA
eukprot:SAG25_NODE_8994_length_393_cov_0.700680_1_plen_44_part_10